MSPRAMRRARERDVRREAKRRARLARRGTLAAGLAVGAGAIFAPGAAQAATFQVNSLDDHAPDGCGSGDCTLRDAVTEANNASGADTVTFQSGLSGTIDLDFTQGQIPIYDGVTINGPGPGQIKVDAHGDSRIFDIYNTSDAVSISGLGLVNGDDVPLGGAIANYSGADLTLTNVSIRHNSVSGDGALGGAVFSEEGSLTISGSVLANNQAFGYYVGYGGGVESFGEDLKITDSTLSNNLAYGRKEHANGGGVNTKYG